MTAKDRPVSKPATDDYRSNFDKIFGGGEEPEDYWAWTGDTLIPLGICEDFDEADDRAGRIGTLAHWIFSRESLTEFVEQAQEKL